MSIAELLLLAVGLSMDAFAVSICKGLSMRSVTLGKMTVVGLYFGLFQAGMPLIGYFLGVRFSSYITDLDHWIAFALLAFLGVKMIKESREDSCDSDKEKNASLKFRVMLVMALATSIDALAVGVTFAFLQVNIIPAVVMIGVVTFMISAAGVRIGHAFGARFKAKAELAGGLILLGIGAKILLEHLGVFG